MDPALDVDQDGLECLLDTEGDGAVDFCCAACTDRECSGSAIPATGDQPWTCALNVTDGYSAAFTFTGVDATIVGVAP